MKKTFTGWITIALSPDGQTLASSHNDNTIKLWDVETGELKDSFIGHSSVSNFIAFSPNGKTLVSKDKETIKLWNIKTGLLISTISQSSKECLTIKIAFSPNGQTIAIFSSSVSISYHSDIIITLYDLENGQLLKTLSFNANYIRAMAFSHDGKTLFISLIKLKTSYIGYPDGGSDSYEETYNYTLLWDLTTAQVSKTFSSNLFCDLTPDGKIFVGVRDEYHTSQSHRGINIIDVDTGENIKSFSGTSAKLSPDGKILAIIQDGKDLKLLDWSSGISIATLPGRISTFAFSPDGNMLAVSDGDTIKLWEESTEPIVQQRLYGDAYPNLNRLENLLAAELWEDADQETSTVIKHLAFPSQELKVVD